MRYNTINSQSELMEVVGMGMPDIRRRDDEGEESSGWGVPGWAKRDPKKEKRLREGNIGVGDLAKTIVRTMAGFNPYMAATLGLVTAIKKDPEGNVKGTATANPDSSRVKPGDDGASKVTEEHKQKIEDEIEARGLHPDSFDAEQFRNESSEFARQSGQGSVVVDNAATRLGIPGALDASELPAGREQELQNHSIMLYGKRYAVQSYGGNKYLIPVEED